MNYRKWLGLSIILGLIFGLPILIISNEFFNNNRILNAIGLLLIVPIGVLIFTHHIALPFLLLARGIEKTAGLINPDKQLLNSLKVVMQEALDTDPLQDGEQYFIDEYLLSQRAKGVTKKNAESFLARLKELGILKEATDEYRAQLIRANPKKKNAHYYFIDSAKIKLIDSYYEQGLLTIKNEQ